MSLSLTARNPEGLLVGTLFGLTDYAYWLYVTDLGVDERMFKRIVKASFGQRRKMLRSSLKPIFADNPTVMERDVFRQRPEQLGVEDFIDLTRLATSIG